MSENLVIAKAREQAVSLSEFFFGVHNLEILEVMQNFDDVTLVAQRFDTYLECFSVVPLFFCQAMIRSSSTQLHCTIFHGTYLVWIGSDAIISTGVGINFILIFLFINVKSSSLSLLLHSIDFPHLLLEACDI